MAAANQGDDAVVFHVPDGKTVLIVGWCCEADLSWFDSGKGPIRHRAPIPQAEGAAGSSLSPPNAAVSPSKSVTVTVSAEWPLFRNRDGTLCAK
jgi:hypothetical protein